MKESNTAVAINNSCLKDSGIPVFEETVSYTDNVDELRFIIRYGDSNCAECTKQKCIPSTDPTVIL